MRHVVVEVVGLLVGEALADVFHDQRPFANGRGGVATAGVDLGFAKDQGHESL